MSDDEEIKIGFTLAEAKKKTFEEKQDLQLDLLYSVNSEVKTIKKVLYGNNGMGIVKDIETLKRKFWIIMVLLSAVGLAFWGWIKNLIISLGNIQIGGN